MADELQPVVLGFDGVDEEGSPPADYTVQFTPASGGGSTPKTEQSEEIGLLEEGRKDVTSPTEAEKV